MDIQECAIDVADDEIDAEDAFQFAQNLPEMRNVTFAVNIGGAGASFLIELAQKHKLLCGTVLDFPDNEPMTQNAIRVNDLESRIDFKPADYFSDPLPRGADVYIVNSVPWQMDPEKENLLLRNIAKAANPGARILICVRLPSAERSESLSFFPVETETEQEESLTEGITACEYMDRLKTLGFLTEKIMIGRHLGGLLVTVKL